ncbi:MAG: PAS domain S-box protein [Chloroflexi bacterium]|nr:PAS domain S-box protein [Chloroflexota bacterium]
MSAPTPLRVLLLEDQPADAELALAELRRAGFASAGPRVETEADFLAALDPVLDVILADYSLPQFDAERALRLVQERALDVPFIVVSGTIGEERAAAIVREGASDYLLKDRLTRLGSAVRQALAQRTLRREKEQAETRFRALIEHAADIIAIIDADGMVRYASPALERILGYQPEDLLDSTITSLMHPEDTVELRGVLDVALAQPGKPHCDEFRLRHREGTWRWFEATATNLVDEPGIAGVVLNIRDVTERRRMEELRAVATERAALLTAEREYARRLEDLAALRADFTSMVAHELGSHIAAVRRWADLLATEPLSPTQDEALSTIQAEIASLRDLLNDAQAAATVERDDFTVVPRPVPIDAVLAEATAFARTLPGDHPLLTEGDTDGKVLVDPGRIAQVLRNLLSNAAKYSPPGVPITLRVTQRGERIRIDVTDRGFGIHPDDLPRIFEKFGRGMDETLRHIPGVGLGLYLSRRIVQAHGADLTAVSIPGEGSTFGFDLEVIR